MCFSRTASNPLGYAINLDCAILLWRSFQMWGFLSGQDIEVWLVHSRTLIDSSPVLFWMCVRVFALLARFEDLSTNTPTSCPSRHHDASMGGQKCNLVLNYIREMCFSQEGTLAASLHLSLMRGFGLDKLGLGEPSSTCTEELWCSVTFGFLITPLTESLLPPGTSVWSDRQTAQSELVFLSTDVCNEPRDLT